MVTVAYLINSCSVFKDWSCDEVVKLVLGFERFRCSGDHNMMDTDAYIEDLRGIVGKDCVDDDHIVALMENYDAELVQDARNVGCRTENECRRG